VWKPETLEDVLFIWTGQINAKKGAATDDINPSTAYGI
jgi:hypothetical protein